MERLGKEIMISALPNQRRKLKPDMLPLSSVSPWLWKWRLGMLADCIPGLANTSVCVLLPVLFASVLIQQNCSPGEAVTPEMSQQALSVSFRAPWLDIPA